MIGWGWLILAVIVGLWLGLLFAALARSAKCNGCSLSLREEQDRWLAARVRGLPRGSVLSHSSEGQWVLVTMAFKNAQGWRVTGDCVEVLFAHVEEQLRGGHD
jgi:hypothetical protein